MITTDTIEETTQDSDVEMTDTELGKEMLPKEDTTFMVGQLGNTKSDFLKLFINTLFCLHFYLYRTERFHF